MTIGMSGWKALGFKTYHEYLQSNLWKEKAAYFMELKGNRCEKCRSDRNLNVHHRDYERVGNEGERDLILLSKECHKKEHGAG